MQTKGHMYYTYDGGHIHYEILLSTYSRTKDKLKDKYYTNHKVNIKQITEKSINMRKE